MAARGTCNWDDGEKPQSDTQAVAQARHRTVTIVLQSLIAALALTALLYWFP